MDSRRARLSLVVFFAVLAPLSGLVEAVIVRRALPVPRSVLILALMWVPALASVAARLAAREGFADLSLRVAGPHGRRAIVIAVMFPLLVCAAAYGVAWGAGLASFQAPDEDPALLLPLWMVPLSGSPIARLAQSLGLHLTIGAVSGCVFAAGEEIGWRGYLVPRLIDARIPAALPLSGLLWALWHWPLVLGSHSPHRLLSLALFTVLLIPMGGVFARLRLESGSVLPAIVLHGLWNEIVGIVFDGFTPDGGLWLGESGFLVVGASSLLSAALLRGRYPARRSPDEAPYATLNGLFVRQGERDGNGEGTKPIPSH